MATKKKTAKVRPAAGDVEHIAADLRPLAVEVKRLKLDPDNARKHEEADLAALAELMRSEGQLQPLLVNKANNVVIAGNGRLMAAKRLGWKLIAVVYVERDKAGHRRLSIADNRIAELSTWDENTLLSQIDSLKSEGDELVDLLSLQELSAEITKEVKKRARTKTPANESAATFEVIVDLDNEADQQRLWKRLTKAGFSCRPLLA